MGSNKIRLRARFPFAIPFQGIEMDDHSVFLKERGITRVISFRDISTIQIQGFSFNTRTIGLSLVEDVTLIMKSGEEIFLYNCRKIITSFLVEKVKIFNPNIKVENQSKFVGAVFLGPLRLAQHTLFTRKNKLSTIIFFAIFLSILLVIAYKTFISGQ